MKFFVVALTGACALAGWAETAASSCPIADEFGSTAKTGIRCDLDLRRCKGVETVPPAIGPNVKHGHDVVIYGGTPAAIAAAVQAKRMGLSVVVVSPDRRIGGMTTGGLGQTDYHCAGAYGGIARAFYQEIARHYGKPESWTREKAADYQPDGQCEGSRFGGTMWTFEPSAALAILEDWVSGNGIEVVRGERLDRGKGGVTVGAGRIMSFRTESGKTFCGKMFVDATYEGDLMAAAGVPHSVGRESNATYGETNNGIENRYARFHQFAKGVDPYVVKGDPKSGLLPGVEPYDPNEKDGDGDGRVQAYCFRLCLTDDPANRIPFKKPAGYDERDYELLFRNFEAGETAIPWINSRMPNRKTDTNNRKAFSSDCIGGNWRWAEASYEERARIFAAHLKHQQGLMWTLANHPRVPEAVRAEVSKWGTCRDEFLDGPGDGWQSQLYVREARRMIGEYVVTEHDCRGEKISPRPVALAAYGMDSHNVRRRVGPDGFVHNEGDVEDHRVYGEFGPHADKSDPSQLFPPYGIDYGALVPKRGVCANLLVPVCVSASHTAYGSIRMEPVFFELGQVSATAAAIALRKGCDVQSVPYDELKRRLEADGMRLKARVSNIDIYPQSFRGGWGLDVASTEKIGSPYLIAHGMGRVVPDAVADVTVPEDGEWRVWARTRNWSEGAPGKFQVVLDGRALPHVFGCGATNWTWEAGDVVTIPQGRVKIALRDLTGFDGRCAGLVLMRSDEPAPRGALDVRNRLPAETRDFDFVVVGGGLPGCCAAVAAARAGLKTALVQDRPVLGGNASSEIRVWCAGEMRHPIVEELRGLFMNRDALAAEGDRMRLAKLQREPNLSIFLSHRAFGVEKRGAEIASVKAVDLAANRVVAFRAARFCDATGDGWIGHWAGADEAYGREAKSATGEKSAVAAADRMVMGASVMWQSAEANDDVPFSAPWAEPFAEGGAAVNGEWFWEYGHWRDMVGEDEAIRDRLLLAIYGAFSLAKKDSANSRRMLTTCPYVLGKRESRRLLGDWILKEDDLANKVPFEDAVGTATWSVDLHFPHPTVPYMAKNTYPHYGRNYIPYRALYSRNVPNLFMAGRCLSCTHVALGGVRVMNTLGQLGVAVGTAAAMCGEKGCSPRDIYAKGHVRELQRRLGGDWPGNPDPAHAGWLYADDEMPGVELSGDWIVTRCLNGGMQGDRALTSHGWKSEFAVYPLPVEKAGRYRIHGRIPYDWEYRDCSAIALVTATSGGRETTFRWQQRVNTGRWNAIGEVDLEPGATLTVKAEDWKKDIVLDGFALEPLKGDYRCGD